MPNIAKRRTATTPACRGLVKKRASTPTHVSPTANPLMGVGVLEGQAPPHAEAPLSAGVLAS